MSGFSWKAQPITFESERLRLTRNEKFAKKFEEYMNYLKESKYIDWPGLDKAGFGREIFDQINDISFGYFREEDGLMVIIDNGALAAFSSSVEETISWYDTVHLSPQMIDSLVGLSTLSQEAAPLLLQKPDTECEPSKHLAKMSTRELLDKYYASDVESKKHAGKGTWQSYQVLAGELEGRVLIKNALTLKALGLANC